MISVIINAISVRINMPRGTVKALMAVLAALLLLVAVTGLGFLDPDETEVPAADETEQAADDSEDPAEEPAQTKEASAPEGVVSLKDYVRISTHYYYHLPDNIVEIWQPEELYAENETMCDFTDDDGNFYSIRSYVLDWYDADIAEIVKADLMLFDDMNFCNNLYIV